MEDQSGVYVFDEGDKENCFEISQVKHTTLEDGWGMDEEEEQEQEEVKQVIKDKNVFYVPKEEEQLEQVEKQQEQEDEDEEEEENNEGQSDEQQSGEYEQKYENPINSTRKQYVARKHIQKIEQYHKNNSKVSFYQVEKVQGSEKQVLNVTNINQFLLSPVYPNIVFQCTMIKVNKGVLSHVWQIYSNNKFLMCAQKMLSPSSKYKVYSNKDMAPNHYIGRIQSNFIGTQWFIFDDGVNPDRSRDLERVRKMLGSVNYQSNFFGKKGPRKMEVHLPSAAVQTMKQFSCLQNMNLLKLLYEKKPAIISRFINKQPQYDQKQDCYKLNFNGKVKTASVKNFILIDQLTQKQTLLFGKISQDLYFFETRYPFTPLQALGMCISSVDRKLGVE